MMAFIQLDGHLVGRWNERMNGKAPILLKVATAGSRPVQDSGFLALPPVLLIFGSEVPPRSVD